MNKLSYNMTQLLNELQTFESIAKKKKGKKVRKFLLKLSLLLLPTRIEKEKRRMEEVENLREDPSPIRIRAPTPKKAPKKRSPKGNVSITG